MAVNQVISNPSIKWRWSEYIPHEPTYKQIAFLSPEITSCIEAFYGGAGGGGKSEALLMAALQYAHVPGYAALLLRRTFSDLSLPEALMDRAEQWLINSDANWDGKNKKWTFPSGATLSFGYLETKNDKYRYSSAEFQYIAFDELTEFEERDYLFLFSRLRGKVSGNIPLRMRSASNPVGRGVEWVKDRFITNGVKFGRPFIPATMDDNPHIDREGYRRSLSNLDPVTRAKIEHGNWEVRESGGFFKREWFEIVEAHPSNTHFIRWWDQAATAPGGGKDPDYTAGAKVGIGPDGIYYISDMRHDRLTPNGVEKLTRQTALLDTKAVEIYIEEEGGSSGKGIIHHYITNILPEFTVRGMRQTGSKETRANFFSAQAEAGNVKLVRGAWNHAFLNELEQFPEGRFDDMCDSTSSAMNVLSSKTKRRLDISDARTSQRRIEVDEDDDDQEKDMFEGLTPNRPRE